MIGTGHGKKRSITLRSTIFPCQSVLDSPYSIDENLWGRANECGILEDPWQGAPADAFDRTKALADTPDTPTTLEITFEAGVPVALDGESLNLADLIIKLDQIAGEHGIGRIDHIGFSVGRYQVTGSLRSTRLATVLLKALKDLEDLTFEQYRCSWCFVNFP